MDMNNLSHIFTEKWFMLFLYSVPLSECLITMSVKSLELDEHFYKFYFGPFLKSGAY